MKLSRLAASLAGASLLFGCGGPVPSGVFLTMSISTQDVAVETAINGKAAEFLSGGANMTGSMPVNKWVRDGENEAEFALRPVDDITSPEPAIWISLEISVKGETVDTRQPGARTIFTRELTEAEASEIANGDAVTITQKFTVDAAALKAIKSGR